jgi:hypothetical protein
MTTVEESRLLSFANHLEYGKPAHDVFDFMRISVKRPCGTAGCAMGELPACFPDQFKFTDWMVDNCDLLRVPVPVDHAVKHDWRHMYVMDSEDAIEKFFGLTRYERRHLFGFDQNTAWYGGHRLGRETTAYQVALQIREFVRFKYHKALIKETRYD